MKLNAKTLRMSRSALGRNAKNDMARRGRASTSRAALLAPDVVLSGRRYRRANGLSRAEAAIFFPDITPEPPIKGFERVSFIIDDYSMSVTGWILN